MYIADYTYEREDGEGGREGERRLRVRGGRRERGVRKGGREREYNTVRLEIVLVVTD